MADETKVDDRFLYIKERIAAAFPKLTGPKFEKSITEEAVKYVIIKLVSVIRYLGMIQDIVFKTILPPFSHFFSTLTLTSLLSRIGKSFIDFWMMMVHDVLLYQKT